MNMTEVVINFYKVILLHKPC